MYKRILSRVVMILLLTGLLVSLISLDVNQMVEVAGQQAGPNIFEADIPVRGAYLFAEDYTTEWDDNGDGEKEEHNIEAPLIVDLAAAGFRPGDLILIRDWGAVRGACDASWDLIWDTPGSLGGVFSSSDTLLWDRSQEDVVGPLHRVPDAIDIGWSEYYVSLPTYINGFPTDIPEDFCNMGWGTAIKIPPGAAYLMLAFRDPGVYNNDGWLKVSIEKDTDEDSLWDSWETTGFDVNKDGTIDLTLAGANWERKDIYVEVDFMEGHMPDAGALNDVENAFYSSPVENPDNSLGIELHVEVDQADTAPHQDVIYGWGDFLTIRDGHFGTPAQRTDPNKEHILEARKMAYHYCLFAHQYASFNGTTAKWEVTTSGGLGEVPGNEFFVSLGAWTGETGSRDEQAGVFMHELGHNLGLDHGGGDDVNYKPNYMSIMNYMFELKDIVPNRPLTFSNKKMPDLNEARLDETRGLGGANWDWSARSHDTRNTAPKYKYAPLAFKTALQVDWDDSSDFENSTRANINNYPRYDYTSSASEVLHGYDDWKNLKFNFRETGGYSGGVEPGFGDMEITWETVLAMREDAVNMVLESAGPEVIIDVSPSSSPGEQGAGLLGNMNYLIIGVAVAVFAVVAVVLVMLRKRKRHYA